MKVGKKCVKKYSKYSKKLKFNKWAERQHGSITRVRVGCGVERARTITCRQGKLDVARSSLKTYH